MALYAGFDCSTQSLTVVVLDARTRRIAFRDSVAFAEPFQRAADARVVHASPRIWADALDIIFDRLARNIDRLALRALSGSAQQHGSVYCAATPGELTRGTSPIWMDTSTSRECEEIEAALGGPHGVARLTGSRAYSRFTGPQIRKFARESPDDYARTSRIHLVSSYMASLLIGAHAPIDHADGSGMNLMDLRNGRWSPEALEATAPGLALKLPPLVSSATVAGSLHERWQQQFGLPAADVVAWSGDNPSSLVGIGLVREGQLAISLGTSDTIFGPMAEPRISRDLTGHVFASPFGSYMGITVFRNGSLARERVRDRFGLTWEDFSDALRRTPPGNGGAMMLPWFEPEITPSVARSSATHFGLDERAPARHVRAIVESQVMALARHSAWMGVRPHTIHATGGASVNDDILQVIADVFDAQVCRFEAADSAALGAAMRAFQADSKLPWSEVADGFLTPIGEPVRPIPAHVNTYRQLRPIYAERERTALQALTGDTNYL